MATVIYPPNHSNEKSMLRVFLAGTIDMGKSVDWQKTFIDMISTVQHTRHIEVFNPRRLDWDPTWEQSIENSQFVQQVTWELNHLESADVIVFHFEPESDSMITLLELGRFGLRSKGKTVLVHCPTGYKRKGNVDIFCDRESIQMVDDFSEVITIINHLAFKKIIQED